MVICSLRVWGLGVPCAGTRSGTFALHRKLSIEVYAQNSRTQSLHCKFEILNIAFGSPGSVASRLRDSSCAPAELMAQDKTRQVVRGCILFSIGIAQDMKHTIA